VGTIILLDANVVGLLISGRPRAGQPDRRTPCRLWLDQWAAAPGVDVFTPAVADYEARREVMRKGAAAQLARLALLLESAPIAPVTPEAWIRASEFWALVRQGGLPTAHPEALDGDAVLAGVAATIGGEGDAVIVATTNARHLGRFPGIVPMAWEAIK
jgi:predicted nucleic acid-binding protein